MASNIDIVILAAGVGSRLRPLTEHAPKCLIPVAGSSILMRLLNQIKHFKKVNNINIFIATGYRSSQIKKVVGDWDIDIVENKEYQTTNNMYSLHLVSPYLAVDRDLIVINGDCVYDDAILSLVFSQTESVIFTDRTQYLEESMKVLVVDGAVRSISKKLPPKNEIFTSIDLYRFDKYTKERLVKIIASFVKQGILNQWIEVAINSLVQDKTIQVKPCYIDGKAWMEIDNLEDLLQAKKLFG